MALSLLLYIDATVHCLFVIGSRSGRC